MRLATIALGFACALALGVPMTASPASADDPLVVKASPYSVKTTLDRLSAILTRKGITVFARIDHAAGAHKVGMELAPTELLLFGNPKLGTPLMKANRRIGIDLPLKALAWRDANGKVWLAYTRADALRARYGVAGVDKVFAKMRGALDKLTNAALKAH